MKFLCIKTWVAVLFLLGTVSTLSANPETCMSCITPTTLSVSQATGTSIKLQWGVVLNVSLYNIEVQNDNGNTIVYNLATTSATNSKIITGLTANKNYKFKVRANCGSNGKSNWSSTFSFNSSLGAGGACGIPANLSANTITATSAKLNWAPIAGATAYSVNIENASGNPVVLNQTFTVTSTSKIVTGLAAGRNYKFKVRAICAGKTGTWSVLANFTTLSAAARFNSNQNFSIGIYPNPSTGIFHLHLSDEALAEPLTAQIYSLDGQMVHEMAITEANTDLDLAFLAEGMYFMRLIGKNALQIEKIWVRK